MIVGSAGHIDHGKTALIKALTGVETDRLKQEQERGITLDLGYAYTPLANGDTLGFVDVPGHEKLLHNMLAGATGIDYVLLVVAADDGIMPQTLEHLQILDLLGRHEGVVAISKIDRVTPARLAEVSQQIAALLAPTGLVGSAIFPLSSLSGQGVAPLRQHLETVAQNFPDKRRQGGFRLAVDRSFTLRGVGTVVTGAIFSGQVAVDDTLRLSPSGLTVRVRGLHVQNQPAQTGRAGQRSALNLAGVEKAQIRRGDWVLAPFLQMPTMRMDVRVRLLADADPLRHWSPVHIHLAAAHVTGRIALLEQETLMPGGETLAQLVLDKPLTATLGDRFILRTATASATLGGGRVLDAHAPARGRRSPQRLAILAAWQGLTVAQIFAALLECAPNGVNLVAFAANANVTEDELRRLTQTVPCVVAQLRPPATAFSPERWHTLGEAALEVLQRQHAEHPDALGLNAEQLRMRTSPQMSRAAFAARLESLLDQAKLARDGSWLHLPAHRITLGAAEQARWQTVAPLLAATLLQPPRVRDISRALGMDEAAMRDLMRRLARLGKVYLVAHDHYYLPDAVNQLADILRQIAANQAAAEIHAAEFRNRIGTGRKLAIQLLEFFDRIGFTRRVGDAHRLRNDSLRF